MFETEAGFAETKMLIKCNGDYAKKQDYKKGWQDGAEFGYNKGKEEMQAQIEKMKCCENCLYKGFGRNFEGRCSIQGHIIKNPFEEKCDEWEIKKIK